ncbi:hypothetical protein PO124_18385 [Bacillus licheniformis]|nr:hypothetical protein [Bacillus licheniformis]
MEIMLRKQRAERIRRRYSRQTIELKISKWMKNRRRRGSENI